MHGASPVLCILPNMSAHSTSFPHELDTSGNNVQTKALKTIVRVGQRNPVYAPVRVSMSLCKSKRALGTTDLKESKPFFVTKRDGSVPYSVTQELVPLDESQADVHDATCYAEATFVFWFNVTAQKDIKDCTRDTTLRLRFTVEGQSDVYVETLPFRLVDSKRSGSATGGACGSISTNQFSNAAPPMRKPPPPKLKLADHLNRADNALFEKVSAELRLAAIMCPQAGQQVIIECQDLVGQLRAKLRHPALDIQPTEPAKPNVADDDNTLNTMELFRFVDMQQHSLAQMCARHGVVDASTTVNHHKRERED